MALEKILIRGVTLKGSKFRPSDWAERLYYALANYGPDGRIKFNPLVNIKQGEKYKCIVINPLLQKQDSMTYDFLIDFAKGNHLLIMDQDYNPIDV